MTPHSYSALSAFQDCPRRYHETKILRRWPEPESQAMIDGKELHEAFAAALKTDGALPAAHSVHGPLLKKIQSQDGTLLVEQKWAITSDFDPIPWNSEDAWLRAVADAVILQPPIGFAYDWKTGKRQNQKSDLQLVLIALVMFAHFPDLRVIGTSYIWLNEGVETQRIVKRANIGNEWLKILPQIKMLEHAHLDEHFPAKPNRFCKRYCSVRSCEYWGK
jgi:hypothetical protein